MTEQSDMARRPMVNLDGRTAIITGSGRGIGAAVAKCLASHGAAVVINSGMAPLKPYFTGQEIPANIPQFP